MMKDAYSFDIDEAGLDASYAKHEAVYRRIFTRCGLEFLVVEADSGAMGGTGSQEFMVSTEAGEDLIASSASGYAANVEKATSVSYTHLDVYKRQGIQLGSILPHAVLDVYLVGLVARECGIQPCQRAVGQHLGPLLLVEKV